MHLYLLYYGLFICMFHGEILLINGSATAEPTPGSSLYSEPVSEAVPDTSQSKTNPETEPTPETKFESEPLPETAQTDSIRSSLQASETTSSKTEPVAETTIAELSQNEPIPEAELTSAEDHLFAKTTIAEITPQNKPLEETTVAEISPENELFPETESASTEMEPLAETTVPEMYSNSEPLPETESVSTESEPLAETTIPEMHSNSKPLPESELASTESSSLAETTIAETIPLNELLPETESPSTESEPLAETTIAELTVQSEPISETENVSSENEPSAETTIAEPSFHSEPVPETESTMSESKPFAETSVAEISPQNEPTPETANTTYINEPSIAEISPHNEPTSETGVSISEPETEPHKEPTLETELASSETEPLSEINPHTELIPEAETTLPESEPVPQTEVESTPLSESPSTETEPILYPETEPSNVTGNPESENTADNVLQSEPAGETEPENDIIPESAAQTENLSPEPEDRPSAIEIVLPPFAFILVIILAGVGLLITTRFKRNPNNTMDISSNEYFNSCVKLYDLDRENSENFSEDEEFFSEFDREVIESLHSSYNTAGDLFKIALPAVLSLALCPFTLYLYSPMTNFLWPPAEYSSPPDINDAIACFLAPAGLVYATSFGFAFQQALSKQHHILEKVTSEISMVDQIATFATKLTMTQHIVRRDIYKAVKAEAIFMILQLLDREPSSYKSTPTEDIKVKIWSIVDLLRTVDSRNKNHVDRVLCEKILSHIMKLNSICSDRIGVLHTKIHPVKWAFLETLGFFSFIGILLLRASSYKMELVMCIITVFSISMLCYVVSDLDSPFSGFFRVDLSVLSHVVQKLEMMYQECSLEESKTMIPEDKITSFVKLNGMVEHKDTAKNQNWCNAEESCI